MAGSHRRGLRVQARTSALDLNAGMTACFSGGAEESRAHSFPAATSALATALTALCLLSSGCSTASLDRSRAHYFRRDQAAALASFPALPPERHVNSLLYLMERATMLQTASNYTDSATDFLSAEDVLERLKIGSISESSSSMAINDMAKSFRGVPFEQVLLHAFAANNYLALGQNDDAAVESRNILGRLSGDRDRFPDIAYAHYLAGTCLELTGDHDGASIEYRKAASLLSTVAIDPQSGRFSLPASTNSPPLTNANPYLIDALPSDWSRDLVCFLGIGIRGPARGAARLNSNWGNHPYADIYVNGVLAGRSALLNDTHQLHAATQARIAAAKAVKTVARTGLKFAAASAISERNDGLGMLVWILLIALENEDLRQWETLPRWLHAARVRCPDRITEVRVVFRRGDGVIVDEKVLPPPSAKSSQLSVTFTRAF